MSVASSSSTEPDAVFLGWIDTTWDALLIIEAARRGVVPRVTRRFHDIEKRSMIRSGAVIVFTEEESGIRRWTDPFMWSASRMLGNFMIYREREDSGDAKNLPAAFRSMAQKPKASTEHVDQELERSIYGSWRRGKGLKSDGLMKKTFSLTVDGATYHLIGYYNPADVRSGSLRTPSSIPHIASLPIGPEYTSDQSQYREPLAEPHGFDERSRMRSPSVYSDSYHSGGPATHSNPLTRVSSPVHPQTSSTAHSQLSSSQWASAYNSQRKDPRQGHHPSDSRRYDNSHSYSQQPLSSDAHRFQPYPRYTPPVAGYAGGNIDAAAIAASLGPWTIPSQAQPSRRPYGYPTDTQYFEPCVPWPNVFSPQPMTPVGF